jgi:hypothetical protein
MNRTINMNRTMHKFVNRMRARSANRELLRAIDGASTPSMRDELLAIAERQMG